MEITRKDDLYQILVSHEELGTLGNCLNEALENVDKFEFQTRVGVERSEVKILRAQIATAYRGL